jgi:hypothetical protein
MFKASSKVHRSGSTHATRRLIGPAGGIALALMVSGGASARPLPVDSSETRAVVQRIDHHMLLMLKLRTSNGHQVLVYG